MNDSFRNNEPLLNGRKVTFGFDFCGFLDRFKTDESVFGLTDSVRQAFLEKPGPLCLHHDLLLL